jgi:hypothetical protein
MLIRYYEDLLEAYFVVFNDKNFGIMIINFTVPITTVASNHSHVDISFFQDISQLHGRRKKRAIK